MSEEFRPFDFVEPCEPDCSPERHSYHRGQWDMAQHIEAALEKGLIMNSTQIKEQSVVGLNRHGNPIVMPREKFESLISLHKVVHYKGQSLLDGLHEMFPDISKGEVRRIIEHGGLHGIMLDATYDEVKGCTLDMDKEWWIQFEIVALGKRLSHTGVFAKENPKFIDAHIDGNILNLIGG